MSDLPDFLVGLGYVAIVVIPFFAVLIFSAALIQHVAERAEKKHFLKIWFGFLIALSVVLFIVVLVNYPDPLALIAIAGLFGYSTKKYSDID